MRSRVALAAVVIAIAIAAVLLSRRCGSVASRDDGAHGSAGAQPATGAATSGHGAVRGTQRVAKLPSGFADAGARERRIAGRVLFAGAPFAGAKVTLSAWGGLLVPPDGERTSAADGTFDLGMRAPGWFEVTASAPGKVAAIGRVQVANPNAKPAPDKLELVLAACETWVVGTVRDAAGPIAGAQIRRDGVVGSETDRAGAYEVCVPPGQVNLEYSADGYGTVQLTFGAELRTRRDVVLVPEAVVQGIAVDEEGHPVADAYVVVNPVEWGPERAAQRSTLSGDDGRFRIAQVMPGRVRVWGFAEGLATQDTQEVLAEVGTTPDVIVTLVRRTSIAGKVMRAGAPIAGAEIVAVRTSPSGRSWNAYTQADGSFVLSRVPPGDVVISLIGYRVSAPKELHVDVAPLTGVIVEVDPMAAIRGRVTRAGAPVAAAQVCCVQRPNGNEVTTDADGAYAFEGVEPGSYAIGASTVRAFSDPEKVIVTASEDHVVDIDLAWGAEITGTVVDEKGAPLRGLYVRFQHPTTGDLCRATSDDHGRYRCSSMTGGAKYVAAVFPTQAMAEALTPPPETPYPIVDLKDGTSVVEGVTIAVVHGRGTITGRVIDTKGAPIVDARIKANTDDRFSSWLALPTAITDTDGTFAIRDLPDATYNVQARSTDGGSGVATKVVPAGPPISITIARPGAITGALAGYPAPPVIYAVSTKPFSELRAGSVIGTSYRIAGLEPGRYLVNAQTTFEGDAREVDVRAGEVTTLDLTATGRATIDATINDYVTKEPVPNMQCHVVMAANGVQGLTNWDLATAPRSDAAGRMRFEPAPAGNVIVGCQTSDPRRSPPSVELFVAPRTTAKLQLWSVSLTTPAWASVGVSFDWRSVAPRVAAVTFTSAAAAAGVSVGDVVVAVDDKPVRGLDGQAVHYLILNHAIGTKVPVTLHRGEQTIRVLLEMRPAS